MDNLKQQGNLNSGHYSAGKKENIYKLDNPENTSSLRTVTIFPGDRKVAG